MADLVQISDGGATPHATDYSDLLAKLVTFATGTTWWTTLQNDAEMTCLQGEGSGLEEIIVSFQKYSDVPTDTYGWNMNGYTGYTAGLGFTAQPGAIPATPTVSAYPRMPLWNSTIPYWFIVNSRRIIVIAKVATVYMSCYSGFILPFATPGQYPYPLFIGGTTWAGSGSTARYSSIDEDDHAFWRGYTADGTVNAASDSFKLRTPDGAWVSTNNSVGTISLGALLASSGMYPYTLPTDPAANSAAFQVGYELNNLDGSYTLTPIEYREVRSSSNNVNGNLMGELDGLYHVSGVSNTVENIIDVAGVDYLVVQNIFRNSIDQFCAVKLV